MFWKWISFVGIMIEAIGFILLSIDLLPEYRLSVLRRDLRDFRAQMSEPDFFEELPARDKEHADDGETKAAHGALALVIKGRVVSFIKRLAPNHVIDINSQKDEFFAGFELADKSIKKMDQQRSLSERQPIILAILFVIAGIICQALGAWPADNRCASFRSLAPLAFEKMVKSACDGAE